MENRLICKCKQVTYFDVEDAMHQAASFDDLERMFNEVQKMTHCSTGCGGCHDKIMAAISEIMHK
ncbi:MAG: (2Fe-2S)-binding protein [Candidatus Faecivicinus sp.]